MYQLLLVVAAGLVSTAAVPVILSACGRLSRPVSPMPLGSDATHRRRLTWVRSFDRRFGPGASTGLFATALGALCIILVLIIDLSDPNAGIGSLVTNVMWIVVAQASVVAVPTTLAVAIVATLRGLSGRILAIVATALVVASLFA